jgi:hypothetical protein
MAGVVLQSSEASCGCDPSPDSPPLREKDVMRTGLVKLALLTALFALPLVPTHSQLAKAPTASQAVARLYEVRLRKLHLVRPDLIAYPMMVEVYC